MNPKKWSEKTQNNVGLGMGALDVSAAVLSTAAAKTTGHAAFGMGVASGVKWGVTGASELTNLGKDRVQTAINTTNSAAGFSSMASTIATHYDASSVSTGFGYFSAAAWGLSAAINTGKGIYTAVKETGRKRVSGALQALSGAANIAAATYSGLAVKASAEHDDTTAARYATISSALWVGGAVTGVASTYLARPQDRVGERAPLIVNDDLESGRGAPPGVRRDPPRSVPIDIPSAPPHMPSSRVSPPAFPAFAESPENSRSRSLSASPPAVFHLDPPSAPTPPRPRSSSLSQPPVFHPEPLSQPAAPSPRSPSIGSPAVFHPEPLPSPAAPRSRSSSLGSVALPPLSAPSTEGQRARSQSLTPVGVDASSTQLRRSQSLSSLPVTKR